MRVVGVLLLALAVRAGAQDVAPEERRPGDEAAKMVDAYILSNMQESLGLTDEQFVKLLPLVKRLHGERRDHARKRTETMRQMRRALQAGGSESRVVELLKQIKALDAEQPEKARTNLEAIDAALTPVQQAKFRVLEMEVEFRIREIMNQIRRQGRPGPRPGRPQPRDDAPQP